MLFFLVLKFQAGHGINYVLFDISKLIIGIFLNASMLCIYFFKFQTGYGITYVI